jgi:predicted component of viral defense system (DUF524 family)
MSLVGRNYKSALALRLHLGASGDGNTAILYQDGSYDEFSAPDAQWLPLKVKGFCKAEYCPASIDHKASILVSTDGTGAPARIKETISFMLRIEGADDVPLPSFRNEKNKLLRVSKDKDFIKFTFVNYLGLAHLFFDGNLDLALEVVPDKIGYDDDYRMLTEDIASECAELLLDYTSPTSNLFSAGSDSPKTLMGQFLFLRQLGCPGVIEGIFEAIRSNPERKLMRLREMVPFGTTRPSPKVFTSPLQHASNWVNSGTSSKPMFLPAMYEADRKKDSTDTEANRFVKFALGFFRRICQGIVKANQAKQSSTGSSNENNQPDSEKVQWQTVHEAEDLEKRIGNIERSTFFKDIGPLRIMPSGNQVLQKRSGYRRMLQVYALCSVAPKLEWDGSDDVYEGESRNIALLYEYWLFFELSRIIHDLDGCTPVQGRKNYENSHDSFQKTNDCKLTIFLKGGSESRQCYVVKGRKPGEPDLSVDLYYNRSFKHKEFDNTQYEGSYSIKFRPDFTIVIYPAQERSENNAKKKGNAVYLHFDAKYRLDFKKLFSNMSDDTSIENDEDQMLNESLDEDKADSVIHVYKNGDLLKMHAYRDAIRRTVGSYILYPGITSSIPEPSDQQTPVERLYKVYSEIIPGVGAFAYSPANRDNARQALRDFIGNVIQNARSRTCDFNVVLGKPDFVQTP